MNDFPIGTIVAYAGALRDALSDAGWLPCDGRGLAFSTYRPLNDVIGSSYGADDTYFYVPNLAGYFLRGVDPAKAVDKDGASRGAPSTHHIAGATGTNPGSVQADGVGPHQHTIHYYPHFIGADDYGDGYGCILHHDKLGNNHSTDATGGHETRPQNIAVHFLIKYKHPTDDPAFVPGLVVAYTGDVTGDPTVSEGWMPCDGRALNPDDTSSDYAKLHDVIRETYGATSAGLFCVPDYQGMFLRGVDGGRGLDPDAGARTAPRPDLPVQGDSGDTVGSRQDFLLGAHTHPYSWQKDEHCLDPARVLPEQFLWNTASPYQTGNAGDCPEVRPKNVAVNRLICWNADVKGFQVPKGAIIAFAGPTTALTDPAWALCDGKSTGVPDYRGWFLRGTDASRAVGTTQQDGFTKHSHVYFFTNGTNKTSMDGNVPIHNGDLSTQQTDVPGPADTRPKNAAVHFLIKV